MSIFNADCIFLFLVEKLVVRFEPNFVEIRILCARARKVAHEKC